MKKNIVHFFLAAVALWVVSPALAASKAPEEQQPAYRYYKERAELEIPDTSVQIPQVVEFTLSAQQAHSGVLVTETVTHAVQPVQQQLKTLTQTQTPTVRMSEMIKPQLTDGSLNTFVDLSVPDAALENGQGVQLTLTFKQPQAVSGIAFSFDTYSARPERVSVSAETGILVNNQRFASDTVNFPLTTVSELTITLQHTQPVRLAELRIMSDSAAQLQQFTYRFLAQPNEKYTVYINENKLSNAASPRPEAGRLFSGKAAVVVKSLRFGANPEYYQADTDFDGIADDVDNCPKQANTDQKDVNTNAIGDACEDFDLDGVLNAFDNCPSAANTNQADVDGDKKGDVCDSEESRLTEQHPWLPWLALGGTAVVIAGLFVALLRTKKMPYNDTPDDTI